MVCLLCPSQVPQCPFHVGHRALEEGGAPVIDMSVDDSDQESPVRLTGNRFEALSDIAADTDVARPRRRLVLISQNLEPSASANEWESDTDSIVDDVIQDSVLDVRSSTRIRQFRHGEPRWDVLQSSTRHAVCAMGSPRCFQDSSESGHARNFGWHRGKQRVEITRGWKLFLLLPRVILFRPHKGGNVPRKQLESRIVAFQEGRWMELLREGAIAAETAHTHSVRRRMMKREGQHVPCHSLRWVNCQPPVKRWKEQLWLPAQCPPSEH